MGRCRQRRYSRPGGDSPYYRCAWCLRESHHPVDIINRYCPCCGTDDRTLPKTCEHRTGSTLLDLFGEGVRYVRRDPWADGNYLELLDVAGFMGPFAWIHSPLEWDGVVPTATIASDVPDDVAMAARETPLWQLPRGGWEAYTGPTVDQRRFGTYIDPRGRVWLEKPET